MENKKLFKKLSEQMEVNLVEQAPITEETKKLTEENVVFEGSIDKLIDTVNFKVK